MLPPLAGLKVLELGTLIAAPFAARMLAEFGADVIKVEAPGDGDPLRKWRKMHGDTSLWWYLQARNKKSVGIDLKSADGQALVRRLAADSDVLIENFRPGKMEGWNLGWDVLHALNPRLVMVRISGFGQTGPYRDRPGFGAIGEAIGGMRYTTGETGRPPVRTGISIGDTLASLHAIIGALMAVMHVKARRGEGQVVDVSLFESVFNVMESLVPEYDVLGHVRQPTGASMPGIAPSGTYRSRDGAYIVIAGNSDSIFRRFMRAIGRDDLAADPRLTSNDGRVAQAAMLDEAIEAWTRGNDAATVLATLDAADVPSSRIYSAADILTDPQYGARGMIAQTTLPDGTPAKMPGIVPRLSATPGAMRWLGPKLGAHTRDVLSGAGLTAAEIESLAGRGVIA
ncbi:MAG: CaiB/BaiF CoA transferase family protein [Pseudolabrys sp.]